MAERLLDRLLGREKESKRPNCYGFALFQLGVQPDIFRDPNKIWEDCEFKGLLAPAQSVAENVMFLRKDLPVIDLFEPELIAFLDVDKYIGGSDVVHVIANIPDASGNILHRSDYNKPTESILLEDVIRTHIIIRRHVAVGFNRKRRL